MKKLYVALVFFGLAALTGSVMAQPGSRRTPLDRLNRQLVNAGAPTLNSTQESAITALIASFRAAHQPEPPNARVQAAQNALVAAVLNQDAAAAAEAAKIISGAQAQRILQLETDRANFGIEVVKILRTTGDPVALLVKSIGTNGTARLIMSLVGPAGPGQRAGQPFPAGAQGAGMGGRVRQQRMR